VGRVMRSKLRPFVFAGAQFLILVAALIGMSPARASTFDYNVSIQLGLHHVTGTIVTDCDSCVLSPTDFVSWSFLLDGSNGISSSGTSPAGILWTGSSPLTATFTSIIYSPNLAFGAAIFFCNGGTSLCDAASTELQFSDITTAIAYLIGTTSQAVDFVGTGPDVEVAFLAEITGATPLPAALPLFATGLGALGLLARRRKRKNATLAGA
jgi:hypothetical protein